MNEQLHCGIYIRKSRESENKQNYRLEHQREALPQYADNRGWTYEVYDDGIMSGRDQCNLQELQRLINDIKKGVVNVVLAIEFSRLSRDETMQDFVSFLALCSEHGVALSTLESYRNPSNPAEWQMMILEGSFSAVEMRYIMKRMKEGRDRARASGKYLGGLAPFGYRYDPATRNLAIDEAEAVIVRKICKMIQTVTFKGVKDSLNKNGIRTRFGKAWTISYLRKMLRYSRLLFYAGRTQVKNGDAVELVIGEWEAIISLADAEFIKRSYSKRRAARYGYNVVNRLLSNIGVLRCGKCGRSMVGNITMSKRPRGVIDVYDYYVCSTNNTDTSCGNACVPTFPIDKLVEEALINQLKQIDAIERAYGVTQDEEAGLMKSQGRLDKELDRLKRHKEKTMRLFKDDLISEDEAKKALRQLNEQIAELQKQATPNKEQFMSLEQYRALRKRFDADKFSLLPFSKKKEFLRRFIRRIDSNGRELTITFELPVNNGEPVKVTLSKSASGKVLQFPMQVARMSNRRELVKQIHELSEGKKGNELKNARRNSSMMQIPVLEQRMN